MRFLSQDRWHHQALSRLTRRALAPAMQPPRHHRQVSLALPSRHLDANASPHLVPESPSSDSGKHELGVHRRQLHHLIRAAA